MKWVRRKVKINVQEGLPPEINLRNDETIKKIYNRSTVSFYFGTLLPGAIGGLIIVIVATSSIILSILSALQGLITGVNNFYIFLVVLIFVIYALIISLAAVFGKQYCEGHVYVITDKRIILFKKFIVITRRDVEFNQITDYLVLQGILGRWKNYGDIQPVTAGVEFGLAQVIHSFKGLTDPYAVKKEIQKFTK